MAPGLNPPLDRFSLGDLFNRIFILSSLLCDLRAGRKRDYSLHFLPRLFFLFFIYPLRENIRPPFSQIYLFIVCVGTSHGHTISRRKHNLIFFFFYPPKIIVFQRKIIIFYIRFYIFSTERSKFSSSNRVFIEWDRLREYRSGDAQRCRCEGRRVVYFYRFRGSGRGGGKREKNKRRFRNVVYTRACTNTWHVHTRALHTDCISPTHMYTYTELIRPRRYRLCLQGFSTPVDATPFFPSSNFF